MHARMRAKLFGFLASPDEVHRRYKGRENTVPGRYAKAVAYHRDAQTDRALAMIDSLIKQQPNDPYFHELKGQILFESSRIRASVDSYRKAVRLAPREGLIRSAYGEALLALNAGDANREALTQLRRAVRTEDNNPHTWRLLGIAYGRLGDYGNSSLALAEHYLLLGKRDSLRRALLRAERHLKPGSPGWQRMRDIKAMLQRMKTRNR
jgi:predicted Zn-dependent protease